VELTKQRTQDAGNSSSKESAHDDFAGCRHAETALPCDFESFSAELLMARLISGRSKSAKDERSAIESFAAVGKCSQYACRFHLFHHVT
jgi:hypothetical protein